MNALEQTAAMARLQARRKQIQKELKQVEWQIVRARLQIITVDERIAHLTRSQRPAA